MHHGLSSCSRGVAALTMKETSAPVGSHDTNEEEHSCFGTGPQQRVAQREGHRGDASRWSDSEGGLAEGLHSDLEDHCQTPVIASSPVVNERRLKRSDSRPPEPRRPSSLSSFERPTIAKEFPNVNIY